MRAFSIEITDDGVLVTIPSAHRPAHLLIGVPLVLYLVPQLTLAGVWPRLFASVAGAVGSPWGVPAGTLAFAAGVLVSFGPGLAGLFLIAYEFRGVERVLIGERRLRVTHAVGRLGWPRGYRLALVREPRAASGGGPASWWAPASGGVRFGYRGRSRGFGAALSPTEAERVVALLEERLPAPGAEPEPDEVPDGGSSS